MTTSLINKHLLKSVAIVKQHLDQELKNLQSTKFYPSIHIKENEALEDIEPKQKPNNMRIQDIICDIYTAKESNFYKLLRSDRAVSS